MAYRFEIHKDKTGQFRVRFKYSGEVIFSTEAYTTKASAQKAIKSIKEKGPAAPIEDLTIAPPAKAAAGKPVAKKRPAKNASSNSTVATATAKPVAAAKAAAKAVRSAIKTAVKTTAKSKT